jgi:hypothetical protein
LIKKLKYLKKLIIHNYSNVKEIEKKSALETLFKSPLNLTQSLELFKLQININMLNRFLLILKGHSFTSQLKVVIEIGYPSERITSVPDYNPNWKIIQDAYKVLKDLLLNRSDQFELYSNEKYLYK